MNECEVGSTILTIFAQGDDEVVETGKFSNSAVNVRLSLNVLILEFHLSVLRSQNKDTEPELLAKDTAEHSICPNQGHLYQAAVVALFTHFPQSLANFSGT